ncbi:MAG TPA: type II toxin-antitoxin system VapC family toxin [Gemmatimonadaceae bacterium]|nr:type II toxin-antitoxin system VapC family toxin [Gemmatimonadaceae bacterium]
MIALDTYVLVRYLVQDDKPQSAAAASAIDRAVAKGEELFVSDVVLCETAWVLAASYKVTRAAVAAILHDLLHAKQLAFASPDELTRALDAFTRGKGEFADYVIREHARTADCNTVLTFDRALLGDKAFVTP